MTITSSTIKLKGKHPLVVLGLSEYEKLMEYIQDMEDRLAIRKRIHEENIPWEETQKKAREEAEGEMSYSIIIKKSAEKELLHLPAPYIHKIRETISSLAKNPRPHDSKKLSGSQNEYRVRVGMYRILYTVHDNILTVFVVKIGHRKDVYR